MTDSPDDTNAAKDLLEWLGFSASPNWSKARTLGGILGLILTLFFVAAFVAAASVLFGTIRDVYGAHPSGPNLGAGALITALLGAPFLIWSCLGRTFRRHGWRAQTCRRRGRRVPTSALLIFEVRRCMMPIIHRSGFMRHKSI